MKRTLTILASLVLLAAAQPLAAEPNRDGFSDVVKTIERFYHVKHQNIPLMARAGMKAMRTAARIKGGELKRIAESGSVRIATFEDQSFDSRGEIAKFKQAILTSLGGEWSALVQSLSPRDEQQTHVFLRAEAEKFQVLIVEIERRDATVVQATVKPDVLAQLLKDPNEMGKALTDEAMTTEP